MGASVRVAEPRREEKQRTRRRPRTLLEFSGAYAGQNNRDYQALATAVKLGQDHYSNKVPRPTAKRCLAYPDPDPLRMSSHK